MTGDALQLFPRHQHAHLRLAEAIAPGVRHRVRRGFSRTPRYGDRAGHAQVVREQTLRAIAHQGARSPVLGVDPELVLVLELNRDLDPDSVNRSGLTVLELAGEKLLVAFAADPDLTEFRRRCDAYGQGARPGDGQQGERSAQYEELFDAIEMVRPLDPQDILTENLAAYLEGLDEAARIQKLRLDIQCWCPEDEIDARRRHGNVQKAVEDAGGTVLHASLRPQTGWSLLRVELAASQVRELANIDRIRRIDLLPRPMLAHLDYWSCAPDKLPNVLAPEPGTPIIAVIDSGIRSSHPLLAPAVIGVEAVGTGLGGGGDEHGHGTLVASLALYGSLEAALTDRTPLRPAGRLLSVRVLTANNESKVHPCGVQPADTEQV